VIRDAALQSVIEALEQAFAGADLSDPAKAALEKVFARLQTPAPAGSPKGAALAAAALLPQTLLPQTLLQQTLAPLRDRSDALAPLAAALATLGPHLGWTTRTKVGPTASANFATSHANAMLVGPGGLEVREDVWIGLSLMAPGTRYLDHDHPPEEVYLVLSEGAFWQGGADWLPRGPGQTVYNPPGILHAMRAGNAAFLALWCLPV
jgi:mannose-6-phosphate isomerase-like protein (cupin superfamily)